VQAKVTEKNTGQSVNNEVWRVFWLVHMRIALTQKLWVEILWKTLSTIHVVGFGF